MFVLTDGATDSPSSGKIVEYPTLCALFFSVSLALSFAIIFLHS